MSSGSNHGNDARPESANELFLERIVECFPGILLVLSAPDFRVVRASSRFDELLDGAARGGASVSGLTVRELGELLNDSSYQVFEPLLQRVLESGESFSADQFEWTNERMGTSYWNLSITSMDGVSQGESSYLLLTAYEVTDAVQARQRVQQTADQLRAYAKDLRAQRAFLQRVIEDFPGLLLAVEVPGLKVVLANSRAIAATMEPFRSGTPLAGRTLREIVPTGGDTGQLEALIEQVAETGEPQSFERYESHGEDSTSSYWNWSVVPVEPEAEDTNKVVLVAAYEVTETVAAQQEATRAAGDARAHAEELDAVISQMADGVVIFDEEGHVTRLNPTAEQMLEKPVTRDVAPGDYPQHFNLYMDNGEMFAGEDLPAARALKGETVVGAHVTVRHPEGRELVMSVSASPLKDDTGRISGAVTVLHDITQEKVVERLKDEFLSVVSHELRTPLSAIMGYSDLMLRGVHGSLNERQARSVSAVRANADRLLQLINDLLDVSRLEAGSVPINPQPVNLVDLVGRTIAQTRVLAVEAELTIQNYIGQHSLPTILADEPRLQQVVENLLSNAIKFTPAGGKIIFDAHPSPLGPQDPAIKAQPGKPELAPGESPGSVVVTVTDTGPGLEEEQITRIWDRFYQADSSAKRRAGGAGLGLAIVRSLVELHGGQAWAYSEGKGSGTTFSFSLPLAEAQQEPELAPGKPARSPFVSRRRVRSAADALSHDHVADGPPPDLGAVLVAEDDEDQREIICDMLEMEGYHVVVTSNGHEALEAANRIKPSALILDVILPGADGWEVLHQLRSNPATKDVPVLIVSVVDQPEFARKLGADEYLIKPLQPVALRDAVRRLVRLGGETVNR